ncbi:MAG: hypothetical protein GXO72_01550, partial [Caldiserica bacterium]|nr:hypothetical protein [Caldisericota bacterium]
MLEMIKMVLFSCKIFLILSACFVWAQEAIAWKNIDIVVCPNGCDFTSLQDAIALAPPGATILVKAGTYTEDLIILKSVNLLGEGADRVVLRPALGPTVNIWPVEKVEVRIAGFKIMGQEQSGVEITGNAHVVLKDVEITGSQTAGIYINGPASAVLEDSKVYHNYVGVSAAGSAHVEIRDSAVYKNEFNGIEVADSAQVEISAAQIFLNKTSGITATDSTQVLLKKSFVYGHGAHGVEVIDSARVIGEDNRIYSNLFAGLRAEDTAHVVLRGNGFFSNATVGILAGGSAELKLSQCWISDNSGGLIRVSEEAAVMGVDNWVKHNTMDFINFDPPSNFLREGP